MKYILIFMIFMPFLAFSQHRSVTGRLTDEQTGEALRGAIIYYNQKAAVSDERGEFQMLIGEEDYPVKVIISLLGYETLEKIIRKSDGFSVEIPMRSSVTQLDEVLISPDDRPLTAQSRIGAGEIYRNNPKNVGDIFGMQPGFGIVKRGGYAMDPVFRSLKYDQLNLIYDGGVYISNACPNRMDPASTQVSPSEIDRIELVKGPYSVRYGQTMGALINIITHKPEPTDEFSIHGDVEGGYEINGNGITSRASLDATGKNYDFSIQGGVMTFDDYKNGDGQIVPSAFKSYNYGTKIGFNPTDRQRLQLSWRQSFGRDIKHASLPMDSPIDNSSILSVDYGVRGLSNKLMSLNAKAYYTFVDHLMSNEGRPSFKMTEALSLVNSTTWGGRLELGLKGNEKITIFVGLDARTVAKDGVRYRKVKIMNGMPLDPPKEFTDLIWQDSWLYDIGAFAEANFMLGEQWDVLAGMRLDYVRSGANNPAPDFEALYGGVEPESDWGFSITSSINYYFGKNGQMQLSVGRGERPANLLERYINHFTVGMDAYEYVGNPGLKPEVNNQADLTVKAAPGRFFWKVNVFYSLFRNFISSVVDESLPRKYMPGTEPLYAKRFVNIDHAWQMGFEAEIGYHFTDAFSVRMGAYYTFAQNVDFDEPLPEIPPLTGLFSLKYEKKHYDIELRGRMVAKQDRVAPSFDEAESPGFSVLDLLGSYSPVKSLDFTFALKNMFNANYYEHLSRPYKNQSETGMFYEPGISVRIGGRYRF